MLSGFTKTCDYVVGRCRSNKALGKCVYMKQQSGLTASPDIGELLDEIDVVDPSKFPSYVEFPWLEGR